jgi:hypothetical protein
MSKFDSVVVLGSPFGIDRRVTEVAVIPGRLYACHIFQVLRLLS